MKCGFAFSFLFLTTLFSFSLKAQNWSGVTPGNIYYNTGNVGIGTSTPVSPLDVKKVVQNGDLMILSLDDVNPKRITLGTASWSGVIGLYDAGSVQKVRISVGNGNTYFNGSNVLVGKTSQINSAYKLDVAGPIRADEIVVNTTGADYVFEKDYPLRDLEEVESFIRENDHLPGIPSAEEMQKEGMVVGELNKKLLEKVEELTLYVIELKGMIAKQNEKFHNLEKQQK